MQLLSIWKSKKFFLCLVKELASQQQRIYTFEAFIQVGQVGHSGRSKVKVIEAWGKKI